MNICKKCGKIYFDKVNACDVCNSKDFLTSNKINLMDYECENCKSMYRNKVEICPNCGSRNIDGISSDRKIISNPDLGHCKVELDTKRFDKIRNLLTVIDELCTIFRMLFGVFFILMGCFLLVDYYKSFLLAIILFVASIFCIVTGGLSISGEKNNLYFYIRLAYYLATVFVSYFYMEHSYFYAVLGACFLYIITTIIQKKVVPKIISINDLELKIVKEQRNSLVKKGILFSNLDYELVPALGKKYYVRVVITSPSGIVTAFQSKQTYSKIDFETVDLLVDIHDFSNYHIFQYDVN